MKKTYMIGTFAVLLLALSLAGVSAYRGDYTAKGPYFDEERHELMEAAFENKDYSAWVELMTADGRSPMILEVIDEDNFATFAAAHEAAQSGDLETAASLRAELGLNDGQGPRDSTGRRMGSQGTGKGMKGARQGSGMAGLRDGSCLG